MNEELEDIKMLLENFGYSIEVVEQETAKDIFYDFTIIKKEILSLSLDAVTKAEIIEYVITKIDEKEKKWLGDKK